MSGNIYCPKCGHKLEEQEDHTLWCPQGEMYLSVKVEGELKRLVINKPHLQPLSFTVGGQWFCPADAVVMHEENSSLACPACGRSLSPGLIHDLVELHPHK